MRNEFDWTDARLNRLLLLFAALSVFACADGGSGCDGGCAGGCGGTGGGTGVAYEYPAEAPVIRQGAQVHVTERGLDFVEDNLVPIINDFLPGGLSFCVPPTPLAGLGDVCESGRCADGSPGCQIAADIASVSLVPITEGDDTTPDRLRVDIGLVIVPGQNEIDVGLLLNTCSVTIDTPSGGAPVSASIYFDVGAPPEQRISIDLPSDSVDLALDEFIIDIDGVNWWDVLPCEAVDLFSGSLTGLLEGFIGDALDGAIGPALCTTCGAGVTCPGGSSCNGDGVCIIDGSETCLPLDLGIETEFDLGSLLADFAPGLDARLGLLFRLAGYADMVGPDPSPYIGIDLSADFGITAAPNQCVPYFPPPPSDRIGKSPGINAETNPAGAEFAIGIGLHQQALDLAMYSVYNSGVLCLSVGSDTIAQISTSTFGPLLPSLGALTSNQNRPMFLQLRPQVPPTVTLGSGEVEYDEEGAPILVDPLLTLNIDDLAIDFYAFVEERYTRLFTLSTDVVLPLGLDVNAANELVILLPDDLTSALTNINTTNGELLAQADVDRVATLLPALIGGLLPTLTGSLLQPIALPAFSGFELRLPPGAFTSVDDNTMLAIYGDLAFVGSTPGEGLELALQPEIRDLRRVGLDAGAVRDAIAAVRHGDADLDLAVLTPTIELDIETFTAGMTDRELEYSYRLGDGLWSFWHRGDRLVIRNPALALQGRHTIEVRARYIDDPYSVSAFTTETEIIVDYEAPRIRIDRNGLTARVDAWDAVSPVPALTSRWRVERGEWHEVDGPIDTIDLSPWAGGNALVEVEVTDESGLSSLRRQQFNLSDEAGSATSVETPGPSTTSAVETSGSAPVDPVRSGCAAAGSSAPSGGMLLLGIALLGLRRRRRAALAAVGAALVLTACGTDPNTGNNLVADPCETVECGDGEVCDDGICVGGGCEADEDCPVGSFCNDGVCEEGDGCASDDECEDGFVCIDGDCVEDNTCGSDDDCPDGQRCIDGACVPPECTDATDCGPCDDDGVPVCVDGMCACDPPCAEGCADGTACCFPTNSCVPVEAECDAQDCPVGTRVAAVADPEFDNGTCEATAQCECVELDPLAPGFIGRHLDVSVAPDQSFVALSAHNETYDDLMIGVVGDGDEIAWSYVDGVPTDGEVTGSLNGPRGGISDDGDDAGAWSALAVGPSGELHVAYVAENDEGDDVLRYALGVPDGDGWDWSFLEIASGDGVGAWPDVVLTPDGRPAVVYMAPGVYDAETSQWRHELRVRFAGSVAPIDAASWGEPVVIDSVTGTLPCGGQCTTRQSCRADTNTCQRSTRDSACDPECADPQACFENEDGSTVCADFVDPSQLITLPSGIGLFADAAFLPDGALGVAHYDSVGGNLRFTRYNPSDASSGTVVLDGEDVGEGGEVVDLGDVGRFPDLFVDAGGAVLIAYADVTAGELYVVDVATGVASLAAENLQCEFDADGFCTSVDIVRRGLDAGLATTADGVSVVFQDATLHEIWQAPRDEFGWQIATRVSGSETDSGSTWGWYMHHGADASGRFVVTHRIDNHSEEPVRDVVVLRP